MLQRLSVRNYAIIDEIEIVFSRHLNVITGETGAGKSIIVGALGLILGERADTSILLNKEKKCIVEGFFQSQTNKPIEEFLKAEEIDSSDEIIIRREIASNGKSRAFINDTPVNLSQLQKLTAMLVDLHQQFDSMELGESGFQRQVIDALAGNHSLLADYSAVFNQWQDTKKTLKDLVDKQTQFEKEMDYNRFQFDELKEAGFKENELEEVETRMKAMTHSEEIKTVLEKMDFELKSGEQPIVPQLKSLFNNINQYNSFHPELSALLERLQSSIAELNELSADAYRLSGHIESDAGKMNEMNERLSLGYKLQKKHGVQSTNELINILGELEQKLQAALNIEDQISEAEKRVSGLTERLNTLGEKISAKRKKQLKPFEDATNKLLSRVGMPNARIKAVIGPKDADAFGMDSVEFLFNANTTTNAKDLPYAPLRKVASGGELSRLMLSIKSLVAESIDLSSMIFDEIDTGISGEAAKQVGIIMKELALTRQVICITHQPQIAGKAEAHFFVYKEVVKDQIKTRIKRLSPDERVQAIAKMIGGETPTPSALANAKELIES